MKANPAIDAAQFQARIRFAEMAARRGLMTKHHAHFPGFGPVPMYELAKEAA